MQKTNIIEKIFERCSKLDQLMLYVKEEELSLYKKMESEGLTKAIAELFEAIHLLRS